VGVYSVIVLRARVYIVVAPRLPGEKYNRYGHDWYAIGKFLDQKCIDNSKRLCSSSMCNDRWSIDVYPVRFPQKSLKPKILCWIVLLVSSPDETQSPTLVSFIEEQSSASLRTIASLISDDYIATGPDVRLQQEPLTISSQLYLIDVCKHIKIYVGARKQGEYMSNNLTYFEHFLETNS
jgi:hypothetical protein